MYTDRIDLSIPQEDIESVLSDIASAAATLEFLPLINPSDRKHLAKLGLKNEGLARRIIELGRANPGLIPRDVEFEKVDRDLLARAQLRELKLVLEKLLGRVNEAVMLTGVDLYAAALEMYHCLRRHEDNPGIRDIIDDIKRGFSRPSRKKTQVEQNVAAAASTVVISPEREPVTSERAAERSVPAATEAAAPERQVMLPNVSPGKTPVLHVSTQLLPHIFSGGFMSSPQVYVNQELAQDGSIGRLDSHWPDDKEDAHP